MITQYAIPIPEPPTDQPENAPENANLGLTALRNALLPEGALSAKFSTTVGPESKPVSGTIYVATHPGETQRILFFKLSTDDDTYIPSVYTLWRNPKLLPLLHTPEIVLEKIRGGADLMTPGLARGPPFPQGAKKGALVAVASYERPGVPKVVGRCNVDVSALGDVRGMKGSAVSPEHWEGDEIWGWSQTGGAGKAAPEDIQGWYGETERAQGEDEEEAEDGEGGVAVDQPLSAKEEQNGAKYNDHVEGEIGEAFARVDLAAKEYSTKGDVTPIFDVTIADTIAEIDNAFRNAFLFAMHKAFNQSQDSHHGISFPVTQSLFVSDYVLPYLPIFRAEDATAFQIKKTSWKNAKKFIKALEKEQLLKAKDRNGGETVILDVDFNDAAITTFRPYPLPKKETSKGEANGHADSNISSDDIGQSLKRITYLKPKDKLLPLFPTTGSSSSSPKGLYLPVELKPLITTYLESENLINEKNKRLVNLNPLLANAVFDSQSSLDREVLAKGTVPRDVLVERITSSCTPYWSILRNDEPPTSHKPKSGPFPMVKMLLETRSGNKTATRVSGLEVFHINVRALAEELQKACASSTSVDNLVGASPKSKVEEIMVQGPQRDVVLKALERRGVRREWVGVEDKTKKKK
jgi:translation initiation factor 2D